MNEPHSESQSTLLTWTEHALTQMLLAVNRIEARQGEKLRRMDSMERRMDIILSKQRPPIQSRWYQDFQLWVLIALIASALTGIISAEELRSVLLSIIVGG